MQQELARSIKRTLEVLEFFDEDRTSASVGQIARELNYPQSSASVLLRSLMHLGYLAYDSISRTYRPTARVALLGRGMRAPIHGDAGLLSALQMISDRTGELVILASSAGHLVHYIHVIAATNPLRMHLRAGAVRSLLRSATGHLFLSALPEDEVLELIRQDQEHEGGDAADGAEVLSAVRAIRRRGYLLSTETATPGGGVLGVLLPRRPGCDPLAVCVGGVGSVIEARAERLVGVIREAIASCQVSRRVPESEDAMH